MGYVKMKDVARMAGVSISTVTRVINHSGYVAADKRAKVENAIERLGYVPNKMAGILKSHNSGIIGNIIPAISSNLFLSQVTQSISTHATKAGYKVVALRSESDPQHEKALLNDLFGRMTDGIILTGGVDSNPEDIQMIINKGMPVIMIERMLSVSGADRVLIDNYEGATIATRHILSLGHTNIGFIGRTYTDTVDSVEYNRFYGFKNTVLQSGVPFNESNCIFLERYDPTLGYQAMKTLMQSKTRPSVVFISSDITAYGALQYLYSQRIHIPEDVSIVGYDNTFSVMTSPAVTSVGFPIEEIGKTAIQLFLERKQQGRNTAKKIILSPFLADRYSVRKI